jgi:signal transduction histidine kinase
MRNSRWPYSLVALFVALLGWYLVYTVQIVRSLREDAANLTRVFAEVQRGLQDRDEGAALTSLFRLQTQIIESGVPLVVTGPGDTVLTAVNLPFEADVTTAEGQFRIRAYIRSLDAQNPPIGDPELQHVHFGDSPELRRLRWIPWLQAGGLALTVMAGLSIIGVQRRVEAERAWTAMARELAHQLGTPLSSLQGWLEVLALPESERPLGLNHQEVARGIEEDLERLGRVSRRFELIGREPELKRVRLNRVVRELERYLRKRLPKLGPDVELDVDVPDTLPPIMGNPILLQWALENVLKNAMDAVAGGGGRISVQGTHLEPKWVTLLISDSGPGVPPEIRDRIFDPGVTTKQGGWGVGLALTRRIVQGVHGGRIDLIEGRGRGATFQVRLPVAADELDPA